MRFRLGLLQDTAAIERQIAKDAAEARKPPTAKTEAETKADEARAKEPEKGKEQKKKPKIRPLSEAKAIDLGANFVSETFLLAVGIALILFENARKGRQEARRQQGDADRIEELEKTVGLQSQSLINLDKQLGGNHSFLPPELCRIEEEDEENANAPSKGWIPWVQSLWKRQSPGPKDPNIAPIADPEATKKDNTASSAPTVSPSVSSKISPRSHPRDINVRNTEHPVGNVSNKPENSGPNGA